MTRTSKAGSKPPADVPPPADPVNEQGVNTPDIRHANLPWIGEDRNFISAEGYKNVRGKRVPIREIQVPDHAPVEPARGHLDARFARAGGFNTGTHAGS